MENVDVKFCFWAPMGGPMVTGSKFPQRTYANFEANKKYCKIGDEVGFDYELMPARTYTSHGWSEVIEANTTVAAFLQHTKRIKLLAAMHPGLWHPGVAAKMGATMDIMGGGGRWGLNITSGWFKQEFTGFGEPWLEHEERYRRSEEFIRCLKALWTEDDFTFRGDFYRFVNAGLRPQPLTKPTPPIFQGGNSESAMRMAARVSDWLFINGNNLEKTKKVVETVKAYAREEGREGAVRCGVNCQIICRKTEQEARKHYDELLAHADWEGMKAFEQQTRQAGASSPQGHGMWADSKGADFLQANDGFKPDMIGTKEQIAEKIQAYHGIGVDLILIAVTHYEEDLEQFGREVIPLVRQMPSLRAQRASEIVLSSDHRRRDLKMGDGGTLPAPPRDPSAPRAQTHDAGTKKAAHA